MRDPKSNERNYFDALKRITRYMDPEKLRNEADKAYGLTYEEALEYAYENVLSEAKVAIRGRRRPEIRKQQLLTATAEVVKKVE